MTDNIMYWLQPPYRCPSCNISFGKPITKAVYNGIKEDAVPIWKCIYCNRRYIQYVNDDVIESFPDISCKFLSTAGPSAERRKAEEKAAEDALLEQQRAVWRKLRETLEKDQEDPLSQVKKIESSDVKNINERIYKKALSCLKNAYGSTAEFREGQYEAIEASLTRKRTLVVQRTGWGKSLVYFIVTKLIREKNKGVTIVVSPLLALMENQQEAAKKLGLQCDCLNSQTKDRRKDIINDLISGELDLVLVTPETMFSKDIQEALPQINIGLFVIDEAHCISDWGHDFRLEYCRLKKVIQTMSPDVPILATTATANNRVIEDLKAQFGEDVYISRGNLMRDNLAIQVLSLPDKASRYAWLLENIPKIPGTGIVYCLTQRDCENLSTFLVKNGIESRSYYSRDGEADSLNQDALEQFMHNDIKVLVSTIKLGMGFDKGDVAFVVHFQMPANVVTYYQQIGRAGRNIPKAFTFLMTGAEDVDIHEYFIKQAFPEEHEMKSVLQAVEEGNGVGIRYISSKVNIGNNRMEKALAFLINDGFIYKEESKYYSVGKSFHYNADHYEQIRQTRRKEIDQMFELVNTKECYNRYIINLLNDDTKETCGCCSNCVGELLPGSPSFESSVTASKFIEGTILEITPRKQWPITNSTHISKIPVINQVGICLSRYGDPGYGELVRKGKYPVPAEFDEKLVDKGAEILSKVIIDNHVKYITCVPSLRSEIVEHYTKRLAEKTGLIFVDMLGKIKAEQQKLMENSSYQCQNALKSFYIKNEQSAPEKIILVDDIVDSKWTLTVCGHLLCEHGAQWVFPFALAESSRRDDM